MVFTYRSIVAAPAAKVFQWHERPEAVLDLLPSRRLIRIEDQMGGIRNDGHVTLAFGVGPFRARWKARPFGYIRNEQFCDEQVSGPFAVWRHTHRVEALGANETAYQDRVEYVLRGGRLFNRAMAPFLHRALTRVFARRHHVVREAMKDDR